MCFRLADMHIWMYVRYVYFVQMYKMLENVWTTYALRIIIFRKIHFIVEHILGWNLKFWNFICKKQHRKQYKDKFSQPSFCLCLLDLVIRFPKLHILQNDCWNFVTFKIQSEILRVYLKCRNETNIRGFVN